MFAVMPTWNVVDADRESLTLLPPCRTHTVRPMASWVSKKDEMGRRPCMHALGREAAQASEYCGG